MKTADAPEGTDLNAVADPMTLQTPSFACFPPEEMLKRLASFGRDDRREALSAWRWRSSG